MSKAGKKLITDKELLNALIGLYDERSTDFEQELFFARRATMTDKAAFRKALTQWIRTGRA